MENAKEDEKEISQGNQEIIEEGKPCICKVDAAYLKYMSKQDYRVSKKYNGRDFVGLVNEINGFNYVIPLTSQTTEKRIEEGKKKRSALITTFVDDGRAEIANLLYNNMFPAPTNVLTRVKIDPEVDTYKENENRYIRKNWEDILNKAKNVYTERYDSSSRNYKFLLVQCCDFKKLESKCGEWKTC
jgi:protein AbiQ